VLFLVEPDLKLKWINLPVTTVQLVDLAGADVGALSWVGVTDKHVIEDVVRLALRHGYRCSRGIVVNAGHVLDLKRPEDLRSTSAAARRGPNGVTGTDWLSRSSARVWTEQGRKLDERVKALTKESIECADRKRAALLAASVNSSLLEHWEHLGARVPTPI
jgi:hypothetical protein